MVLNDSPAPSFIICGKRTFAPGEVHVTRKFARSVLILMLEGNLKFIEDGSLVTLTPGEYYIQRNNLFQQGVPMNENLPKYYFFEFFGTYSEGEAGLPLRGKFDSNKISSIAETCVGLYLDRSANKYVLNSYLHRVLGELLDGVSDDFDPHTLAENVHAFIDSKYTSPIRLEHISKCFGYTEEYILRIFKKRYGISPHQYLVSRRMEYAKWLLENTDSSVQQIAVLVGYTDTSPFYRNFKKIYGFSPKERKKAKNE